MEQQIGVRGAAARPFDFGRISEFISNYGLALVFVLVMVAFGLLRPTTFLSASNINNILVGQSVTAMLALAEMVPLATRQFDLSVGFHLGMAQVLIVALQVNAHFSWPAATAIVLGIALLVGLFNAVLVTVFNIDSFIATMGVGTLLYGVSNWYTGGQQIVGMDLPVTFGNLTQIVGHVPLPAVYVAVVAIILDRQRASAGRARALRDRREPARG